MSDKVKDGLSSLDYWRLCDELNIIQASLLIIGNDPSSDQQYIEGWDHDKRPDGYEAVKAALLGALKNSAINGSVVEELEYDMNGNCHGTIEGSIDLKSTTIAVNEIKKWLASRGMTTGFFFPEPVFEMNFLDVKHPRYSPKLAATVTAWLEMENGGLLSGKSVKQSLEKWLRLNAKDYGLCDDEGKPNEKGIDECAKVANWNQKGGAPNTLSSE